MNQIKIFVGAGLVAIIVSFEGWVLVESLANPGDQPIATVVFAMVVIAFFSGTFMGLVGYVSST